MNIILVGDDEMNGKYSKEFITVLSNRLNEHCRDKVDRTFSKSLARRRSHGEKLDYTDLDRETLKTLCVYELCPDGLIAALFNMDIDVVKALRDLYGYTDETIPQRYTAYITGKLAREIEEEMGEAAYN